VSKRRIWLSVLFGSLLLLGVAAFFLAKPFYQEIKRWRALALIDEAQEQWEEEDYRAAVESVQAAYQLYPKDLEVIRATAELYTLLDPSHALLFWKQAVETGGVMMDRYRWIETALLANNIQEANLALADLESVAPDSVQTRYLKARVLMAEGRYAEALKICEALIELDQAPEGLPFLYVQLTQLSPDTQINAEGVAYLRKLAQRDDALGLQALRYLTRYPGNTKEDWIIIIEGLKTHPDAERFDQLLALSQEYRVSGNSEALLEHARKLFDTKNLSELVELGRWLNKQSLYAQTAELITEQQALQRRDLLLIWLDALAVTNQWQLIHRILDKPGIPLDPFLRHLFMARVYLEEGEARRAALEWDKVRINASNDPEKLWFLVDYAERLGLVTEVRETLEALTRVPSAMRQAYEAWVVFEIGQKNTRGLNAVLEKMHGFYRKDQAVLSDLLYTDFLLQKEEASALKQARELVDKDPSMLAYRVTLALGLLRANDASEALKLLQVPGIQWEQVRPNWRAVYVAVLKANGDNALAQELEFTIPMQELLLEERALF
tara:strand:- start:2927 stop:4582 length:1656 start_codon:yes stop_codon:yes gene_type:complete